MTKSAQSYTPSTGGRKPTVKLERDGAVAIVSFDRPEKLNAWAWGPTDDLWAIADELRFVASVRGVVLRGEGRAFCAGEDFKPETTYAVQRHPGRCPADLAPFSQSRASGS